MNNRISDDIQSLPDRKTMYVELHVLNYQYCFIMTNYITIWYEELFYYI
jgi:hypothetical protein